MPGLQDLVDASILGGMGGRRMNPNAPFESDMEAVRTIGGQLLHKGFPLPSEDAPLSENVENREAPIWNRMLYPTGITAMFKQRTPVK